MNLSYKKRRNRLIFLECVELRLEKALKTGESKAVARHGTSQGALEASRLDTEKRQMRWIQERVEAARKAQIGHQGMDLGIAQTMTSQIDREAS